MEEPYLIKSLTCKNSVVARPQSSLIN